MVIEQSRSAQKFNSKHHGRRPRGFLEHMLLILLAAMSGAAKGDRDPPYSPGNCQENLTCGEALIQLHLDGVLKTGLAGLPKYGKGCIISNAVMT